MTPDPIDLAGELAERASQQASEIADGYALALLRSLPEGDRMSDYRLCVQPFSDREKVGTRYWLEKIR